MRLIDITKRCGVFVVIIWLAASLNFFLPKLSGQDPVRSKLLQQAALGGYVQSGIDDMVKVYEARFGLDRPLWQQYFSLALQQGLSRLRLWQLPPLRRWQKVAGL